MTVYGKPSELRKNLPVIERRKTILIQALKSEGATTIESIAEEKPRCEEASRVGPIGPKRWASASGNSEADDDIV